MAAGQALLDRIVSYVVNPAIAVLFTLGLLLFILGIVEFLWKLRGGSADNDGKQHMLWGMVGMLIMVSVYGIVTLISNTLGIDFANPDISRIQNVNPGANFFGR